MDSQNDVPTLFVNRFALYVEPSVVKIIFLENCGGEFPAPRTAIMLTRSNAEAFCRLLTAQLAPVEASPPPEAVN